MSPDIKGGIHYDKLKRHYERDDYASIDLTSTETLYICGTNARVADPNVPLFEAKSTLFYATQDCLVRFNDPTRVQHFIPAATYLRLNRKWTKIYVLASQPEVETFGKTTIGSQVNDLLANEKATSEYTLAKSGTVTSISCFFDAAGFNAKAGIYVADGVAGVPGTLVVQGASEAITAGGWHTWNLNATALSPAGYWLTVVVSGVASIRDDGAGQGRGLYVEGTTYADELISPCQAMIAWNRSSSIYATYTPSVVTTPLRLWILG